MARGVRNYGLRMVTAVMTLVAASYASAPVELSTVNFTLSVAVARPPLLIERLEATPGIAAS